MDTGPIQDLSIQKDGKFFWYRYGFLLIAILATVIVGGVLVYTTRNVGEEMLSQEKTAVPTISQKQAWQGVYDFAESTSSGSLQILNYELTISGDDNSLGAKLNIDGSQTMTRIIADAKSEANGSLAIVFNSYGPDNTGGALKAGDTLFTLIPQPDDTYKVSWDVLQPMLSSNKDSAVFTKVVGEAGLKIYRNDKYGFEFKYPSSLTLSQNFTAQPFGVYVWDSTRQFAYGQFGIKIYKKSLESVLQDLVGTERVVENKVFASDFITGVSVSISNSIGDSNDYVLVERAGNTYILTNESVAHLNIISTFKFLQTDETANWKTYRNEEYGFSIKYPASSSFSVETDGLFFEGDFLSHRGFIKLDIENTPFNDVQDWFNDDYKERTPIMVPKSDFVKVRGVDGLYIHDDPMGFGGSCESSVVFLKNKLAFKLFPYCETDLQKEMLSSFKFDN